MPMSARLESQADHRGRRLAHLAQRRRGRGRERIEQRRRRRAAGRDDHGVCVDRRAAARQRHPPAVALALDPLGGGDDPPLAELPLQRPRQLLQPVGERHRLAEPAALAPLLDRAAHHAAVRAFQRRQAGQRARHRQLGGVAGVDADHRRRHQRARRLVAEAARGERQHRLVTVGRAAAQERLAQAGAACPAS